MEEFRNLSWRISEPSTLDVGTNFIKEDNIVKSYAFTNNFTWYDYLTQEVPKVINDSKSNVKRPHYPHSSRLNMNQHVLCLKATQLLQSDRSSFTNSEQQIINNYNNLRLQINEENTLFLKYVEKEWNRILHHRTKKLLKRMFNFGKTKWKYNLESVKQYDTFYKLENMLPISGMDNVDIIHEGCLLELGTVAKVTLPDLNKNAKIGLNKIPSIKETVAKEEILKYIKLPASRDSNAEQLAKQYGCDVVITSSGLKTIIANFGSDYSATWDIPVIVKECEVNGEIKNVIYIDKPLPQRVISTADINIKCRKVLLKTNMCRSEALRFNIPETLDKNSYNNVQNDKGAANENCIRNNESDFSEEFTKCSSAKRSKENDSDDNISECSAIDSNIAMNDTISDKIEDNVDTQLRTPRQGKIQMHHNVSYRIWRLGMKEYTKHSYLKGSATNKEIKILTRCKTDGYEVGQNGVFNPVSLVPKLEYQWEYGGELVTKNEVLRQWTQLYFRPFSRLLRVRMNGTNQDYIKIENINLSKIVSEGLNTYNFTPLASLGVLYNVLSNMINLQPGQYLLHHSPKHGPFVAIMRSVQECTSDTLDLHNVYSEKNCRIEETSKWNSIDTTLILPFHTMNGLMPGMFPPHQICKSRNNKGKKKKKKAKKKQVKINE